MATNTPAGVRQYGAAIRTLLVLTVILGLAYPLAMTGIAQVAFGGNADGSLVDAGRQDRRVRPDRPGVHPPGRGERQAQAGRRRQPGRRGRPDVLPEPTVGRRHRVRPTRHVRLQPRSGEQGPHRCSQGTSRRGRAARGCPARRRPCRRPAGEWLGPRPAHQPGVRAPAGCPSGPRTRSERGQGASLGGRAHPGTHTRFSGRAEGERARAQPGARPGSTGLSPT